jgi:hypothetical protein
MDHHPVNAEIVALPVDHVVADGEVDGPIAGRRFVRVGIATGCF